MKFNELKTGNVFKFSTYPNRVHIRTAEGFCTVLKKIGKAWKPVFELGEACTSEAEVKKVSIQVLN